MIREPNRSPALGDAFFTSAISFNGFAPPARVTAAKKFRGRPSSAIASFNASTGV